MPSVAALFWALVILPVPSLAIGWIQFIRANDRFAPSKWRRILGFSSLVLASLIGIFFLVANFVPDKIQQAEVGHEPTIAGFGLVLSLVGLVLSLLGKRPLRLPTALAAIGLGCLWMVWRIDI